jgi:ATP-dependent RNA helicase DeaD
MVGGVWFSLTLGRKHRADPKWLLPLICKAGGVTKRDVGSIKIDDTQTRFEIAAGAAEAFAAQIAQTGSLEKGVTISRSDGGPGNPRPAGPPPARQPYKVRTDKGEKLDTGFDFSKPKPKAHKPVNPSTPGEAQAEKKARHFPRKAGR